MAPTVAQAFSAGARAALRSAWLAAPALVVALGRTALAWAPLVTALALARGGAAARLAAGAGPRGAVAGAALALTAPRSFAILAGLFAAGAILAAALRVAWLAGALPVVGAHLAGAPPERRFAAGLAYGSPRLLGTALVAFLVEALGQAMALAWVVGTLALSARRLGGGAPFLPALLVAGSCAAAVLALVAAPLVADAALARAALAGDSPGQAVWNAALRFARRPAAFLALALALGFVGLAVTASLHAASSAALGFGRGAPAALLVPPQLMTTVLGAAVAAVLELWRVGALAALACSPEAGRR
jgi:hypothetical protein